jgi:hypothetical protein
MFYIAKAFENLHIFLFFTQLSVMIWKQAISTATGGPPIPAGTFMPLLGPLPLVFVNLSAHSPPMAAAAGHKNKSKIERSTLYIN